MKISKTPIYPFLLFSLFQVALAAKKTYIVYLGSHTHGKDVSEEVLDRVTKSHHEFLATFLGSHENAKDAMVYTYQRHINGFAANLEEGDAAKIANHPGVISVFLNQGRKLHTTHSWEFMMLEKDGLVNQDSLWQKAKFGEDVIIGNLDTGVWPESMSFNDEGYGPIPSRWRGTCQNGSHTAMACNRKLIGARYFNKGYVQVVGKMEPYEQTPRDLKGHGSHTLSTAGGNFVAGASVFGVANGTAKGGSPRARVATYKVCFLPVIEGECFDVDILAGFDMAIHDRVDVLSISIGSLYPLNYFYDSLAIGTFHAVKNGITVVCSAGNGGPSHGTVVNVAPWILTVGASTLDREFRAVVEIGNGMSFTGKSYSEGLPNDAFYPLITGEQAKTANASTYDALLCKAGTLDPKKAKGKILVCLRGEIALVDKGHQAALVGAAGMILCNHMTDGNTLFVEPHVLPAAHISYADGATLIEYIYSTKNPVGSIRIPSAGMKKQPAPSMADFSSVGPNMITPEILKPDITAPGVNILAAYSEAVSLTGLDYDNRRVPYYIMSGTSMSCPHVSGIVGLLKALHPNWSSAAIKSAIMTTARTRDNTGKPMLNGKFLEATPFDYGAGHVRPNRAMDPGLIYDLNTNDYLNFLCASGYNNTLVQLVSGDPYQCPESVNLLDFNYPSITIPDIVGSVSVTRRVRNVGSSSTYVARVREPTGFSVSVYPSVLTFEETGTEKSFAVTVTAVNPPNATVDGALSAAYAYGGLTWSDGFHYVRSPIVVAGWRIN